MLVLIVTMKTISGRNRVSRRVKVRMKEVRIGSMMRSGMMMRMML